METYEESLKIGVNKVIDKFMDDISAKFKISKKDLECIWNGRDIVSKSKENVIENKKVDYNSLKKNDLVKLCKERDLSIKGIKKDLVNRLIRSDNKQDNIVEKLDLSLSSVIIKKNTFGNYVHAPTNFVFNRDSKSVIGKEDKEGNILVLTKNDINICNKYKFKFTIPDDLNVNKQDEEDDEIIDDETDDEETDDEDETEGDDDDEIDGED